MSVVTRPTARTLERSLGVALVGVPAVVLLRRHRRVPEHVPASSNGASAQEPRPVPTPVAHIPIGLGLD